MEYKVKTPPGCKVAASFVEDGNVIVTYEEMDVVARYRVLEEAKEELNEALGYSLREFEIMYPGIDRESKLKQLKAEVINAEAELDEMRDMIENDTEYQIISRNRGLCY